jgi:hypothetical protein
MSYAATASTQRVREAIGSGLPALALGLGVAPVLATNGGYFPSSWGWAGVLLAWGAVLAAMLTEVVRPSGYELAFVGGLAAFAGWIAITMAFTTTQSETGLEFQRTLVYVAGALAVLTIVGRDQVGRLLAGVCAGTAIICTYALATRLFPKGSVGEAFSGSRLATPVGYWNGLALVAVMSALLALAFAARATLPWGRALAAAAIPVLLATLYFTFSRGGWLSLFFGLIVLFAADRKRLQLLGAALPAAVLGAIVVWRASQASALTHTTGASLHNAVHQGRILVAVILGASLVAGYTAWIAPRFDGVWERPDVARLAKWAVAGGIVILVVATIVRFGSPTTNARHAYHSFTGAPVSTSNLNDRLFNLSANGRVQFWKVAWHGFEAHPVAGLGAGGFEAYWNQHRPVADNVRDAHNLYVETLAEDGLIGLALLAATLLVPLLAFRRVRANALAAAALAVYATYLFHSIADWDWELSGVTLTAIFCGGALLAWTRGERPLGRWRWPIFATGALIGLIALVLLVGRLELSASASAATGADWSKGASDARHAHTLMPWSAEPWQRLGDAQLGLGHRADAVASYKHAIAQSPGDYSIWIQLAKADRGPARWEDLAVALKLNPLNADEVRQVAQQLLERDGP